MLRPRWSLAIVAFAIGTAAAPCLAWSPRTRTGMVDDAIKMMPRSLRLALEGQRESVLRGALGPMVAEDGPEHRAPWAGGTLDGQIEAEARVLIEALGRSGPFESVSEQFGRLAHFVMDAAFPPGVGAGDGHYAHFAEFCETRRPKFRFVFYGHDDKALAGGSFREFALGVMSRAREEDRELARVYATAGDPPSPAAFDDRSIPFAVGSLAYSHGVTDLVRAWLAAWRLGGGDIGRTPYLEPAAARERSGSGEP